MACDVSPVAMFLTWFRFDQYSLQYFSVYSDLISILRRFRFDQYSQPCCCVPLRPLDLLFCLTAATPYCQMLLSVFLIQRFFQLKFSEESNWYSIISAMFLTSLFSLISICVFRQLLSFSDIISMCYVSNSRLPLQTTWQNLILESKLDLCLSPLADNL